MNYPKIIEHLETISSPSQETCQMLGASYNCLGCPIFKMTGKKKIPFGGWGCREYINDNRGRIIQHFVTLNRKEKLSRLLDK